VCPCSSITERFLRRDQVAGGIPVTGTQIEKPNSSFIIHSRMRRAAENHRFTSKTCHTLEFMSSGEFYRPQAIYQIPVQGHIRENAASAGAEGGAKTTAGTFGIHSFVSLRDQSNCIVKVPPQSINSIPTNSGYFRVIPSNSDHRKKPHYPFHGGISCGGRPVGRSSRQFKPIQADSSEFKQIQPQKKTPRAFGRILIQPPCMA